MVVAAEAVGIVPAALSRATPVILSMSMIAVAAAAADIPSAWMVRRIVGGTRSRPLKVGQLLDESSSLHWVYLIYSVLVLF